MTQETNIKTHHNIIMESRKKLSVTGVCDIDSFNEQTVIAITTMGALIIKGENLHIGKFNIESRDLDIDGNISSLTYTQVKDKSGGSIIKNLFK